MKRISYLFMCAGLFAMGCVDPAMNKRLEELEARVEKVEKAKPAAGPASAAAAPTATEEEEKAAKEIFDAANAAMDSNKIDEAKAKLAELEAKHSNTKTFRQATRLKNELAVVGTDAGQIEVEKWFVGNGNFSSGKASLVVFWETWCPHCQREVPKLEETYTKFKDKGLNVVALTKVTKSSTDEKVNEFIKEHKLTFPMGKEKDATMSNRFGVSGIPAAVIIKDGKVVWRGHPARLSDDKIQAYL